MGVWTRGPQQGAGGTLRSKAKSGAVYVSTPTATWQSELGSHGILAPIT